VKERARNPHLSRDAAVARFRELLVDPDPASLDVAEDVVQDAGLSLADLGEMLAKEGPEHLEKRDTKGWADEFPSAGEFSISTARDTQDFDYTCVSWMVWQMRPGRARALERARLVGTSKTIERMRRHSGVRVEINVAYKGTTWMEALDGFRGGLGARWDRMRLSPTDTLVELPEKCSIKTARRIACELAWRIAKELKEHAAIGSDEIDVVTSLHDTFDPTPKMPREIVGNPPRMFRPQKVVGQLQKETRPAFAKGQVLSEPVDVAFALAPYMGSRPTELFVVLFIDVRNRVVGYTEFSSGSVASVQVDVSGIIREALLCGAAGMVTAHQHPSGSPDPSADDIRLWKRIKEASELVGVPLVDNLVIGEDSFFSESMDSMSPIPVAAKEEWGTP
jgi:DNA repair protein RadC